ncbi:MAG: TIGR02300 family protein [Hyphomicrobiaceae bacterium]
MKLASFEAARAARGNKRVCEACETRFYDVLRSPIVCPSCGAQFTPRIVQVKPPSAPKSRWRQDFATRPKPVPEEVEANDEISADPVVDEEITAEDVKTSHEDNDDSIPEEVQDDGDVSGLLDVEKAKDD